jgi:hypothetical protein
MLDRQRLREHHIEVSYLLGRFMTEHLIRVNQAFGGDLTAAVVLAVIGQYNVRRYYDEIAARSEEGLHALVTKGAHRDFLRPCNAMSVSASTGIPRETVRRKIAWLVEKGWIQKAGRDKLLVTSQARHDFADFDLEALERFYDAASRILPLLAPRGTGAGTRRP